MERTVRVVLPLAVHQESVMILPGREFQNGSPDAISTFLQIDGFLIPVREVSHQLHAGRVWRSENEGLFSVETIAARCLFLHVCFLL